MTKQIAVINPKGGVGKSTFTDELAHRFDKKGYKVFVADLDDQQSTFYENKEFDGDPDYVLIDTRGALDQAINSDIDDMIRDVDLVLIPVLAERDSIEPLHRVMTRCKTHNANCLIVFNQLNLRELVAQRIWQEVVQAYPDSVSKTYISRSTTVSQARDCYISTKDVSAKSKVSRQFDDLVKELLKEFE